MAKIEGIYGTLISINTTKKELTLEESIETPEAEPAVADKSYSYDLDDHWDEERFIRAVGEPVYGTLINGVVKKLYLRA